MIKYNSPPLHILRATYRFLKTPTLPEPLVKKAIAQKIPLKLRSNQATKHLIAQYRAHADLDVTSTQAEKLRQQGFDFYRLRRDLAERTRLLAMDTGADQILTPREMSRRAAARAGLQLPKLDETLDF
jgi:hypothetical protein